jgi:exodeoxyribonuclease V gamma subunit
MPATPDFRLYHSNSLEVLAGLLASELREPVPGQALLVPDTILIPQPSMRRWLQASLAEAHGIAANLEFLAPGQFVRHALDCNRAEGEPGDDGDELDSVVLRWRLYAQLADPATLAHPALASLHGYLADDDPRKRWSLAGELAAAFEKYQAWRRDWLAAWEAGRDPQDPQAELWRRIARGRRHRARRIGEYLARFGAHDGRLPQGLPPRLFVFATVNVSPDVLRVIATQARAGTLHFYLPTPAGAEWGDLQTVAERLRQDSDAFATPEHPLLSAWGAAGRDFMALLGSCEVVHPSGEIDAGADPLDRAGAVSFPDGLLRRLQHDLFHRRARPSGMPRPQVDRNDPTLQVHACHSRLREVQVLHDQLRGLLEDPRFDPPLQPREIAVLAPDIDPYLPTIEAVFGGRAGHADFIPFAVADASPLAGEPLADTFLRLLALPLSRFGLQEILDLLASPPLAAASGLNAAAIERLRGWLHGAGARWGLDAAHRQRHGAPADDAHTWRFALDRLLLGHAAGDDVPIVLGRGTRGAGELASSRILVPWPELEGSALDALDTLLRLLRVLARHERALAAALPPARWRERLLGLLDALFPVPPAEADTARALERLRALIDGFAADAARAGFEAGVPAEVVRAHFAAALGTTDARAPLLSGGVSFARMVPMRLLPFRAICVLGLDDGAYPRRDPGAGLDRLAAGLDGPRRRCGDRSLRDDDRFLFLQLLAAAGDVLYLSHRGADPRDGSAREPSVLVSELLDAAADYHADPAAAREALVLRHPLQPFAPAAFGATGTEAHDPRRFSYHHEWHPAAGCTGSARASVPAWWSAPSPAPASSLPESLSIAGLRRFLRDPAGEYLRTRLAMRLPEPVERFEDVEPLQIPGHGLDAHTLRATVLEAAISGDTGGLLSRLRARGLLPPGPLATRGCEQLLARAQRYAALLHDWRGGREAQALAVDLELDGVRVHGQVEGLYEGEPDGALARLRMGKQGGPGVIRDGLDWLLANAAGHGCDFVRIHDLGKGAVRETLPAPGIDVARDALRSLLRLRTEGLAEPLPWAPYSGWEWFAHRDSPLRARKAARERWHGSNGGWAEGRSEALRLAMRGRDLFVDPQLWHRFEQASSTIFIALTEGRPARGDDAREHGA